MSPDSEVDLQLFQPPLYQTTQRKWFASYEAALRQSPNELTWNPTAILSLLSFNYVCADNTLVSEINRKPWLSGILDDGNPRLRSIPPHGRRLASYREIAKNLKALLMEEALSTCEGRDDVFVLLSGGLDSRVTAGILAALFRQGRLRHQPTTVTWGLSDSADVIYGQAIARLLGLDWVHVPLDSESVHRNIDAAAKHLGGLVSPIHLHGMLWFDHAPKEAVVVASSYGDMVGRAEFAHKHLLELALLRSANRYGLLSPDVLECAHDGLEADLSALHARTPGQPKYVLCEHEMHCHYTRGMLGQAMSVINESCSVYQMFTHPAVYSYMWSIHPSLRFDGIYAELLSLLEPKLLEVPWARTNRTLTGKPARFANPPRPSFHDYPGWISGPLYDEAALALDPEWFRSTGLFNAEKIKSLRDHIGRHPSDLKCYDTFLWLVSFRRFAEWIEGLGKRISLPRHGVHHGNGGPHQLRQTQITRARDLLSRVRVLRHIVRGIRRPILRARAWLLYPPTAKNGGQGL